MSRKTRIYTELSLAIANGDILDQVSVWKNKRDHIKLEARWIFNLLVIHAELKIVPAIGT